MSAPSHRENVQAALLARMKSLGIFKIATRKWIDSGKLAPNQQPAIGVHSIGGQATFGPAGTPAKWKQTAALVIYARESTGSDTPVETDLFALIAQVETGLARQTNESTMNDANGTTLGGLVWSCHLVNYQLHEGAGEGQAVASLMVEMIALV